MSEQKCRFKKGKLVQPVPAEPLTALESGFVMTDDEADKSQEWKGMDGAIAFHLIERHANNWHEIGVMMRAWLRANSVADKDNHG